ncbi:MAG: hypothetical protein HYS12_17095 [Planctomycetes bacterium]|nr:hypothetical protein [Planctomycetota bacterium]
MNARLRIGSIALAVAVAVAAGWALRGAAPDRAPPGYAPDSGRMGFAGTPSCSARACHGGIEPLKDEIAQRNEYTHTLLYDKHARAYQVLGQDRGKRMAENLGIKDAREDERCLACHTVPQFAPEKAPKEVVALRSDGVGCEACHGPARGPKPWLTDHTVPGKWREKLSPSEKAEYGFTDLSNLRVQAEVCAGCHVGAPLDDTKGLPTRDVHHDLMAAGHPRLNFELSIFRANMPPHWNEALKNKKRDPGAYEAKVWAIGRVASAKTSLELLRYRGEQALKAKETMRWPEFAEYSCFACHGDLDQQWKSRQQKNHRPVGSLPYDPWYGTLLPELSEALGGPPPSDEMAKSYEALAKAMAQPFPRVQTVKSEAGNLVDRHKDWLDKLATTKYDSAQLLKSIASSVKGVPPTWEQATQLAYAVAALKRGDILAYQQKVQKDPGAKKPADLEALEDLLKALAFPHGSESPSGVDGPLPAQADVQKKFRALLDALGK